MVSAGLTAGLLLSAACSDDSVDSGKLLTADGELWMLETRVYTADESTGYAIAVDELKGEISNKNAIEQFGGGLVFANSAKPDKSFLLTHAESPEAIRYQVSSDNDLQKGKTVSFEKQGVETGYGIVAWVDAHTAYWFDGDQKQAISFDPTEMEIKETIAIEGMDRDGFRSWFSDRPVIREDAVLITVNWSPDWEDGTAIDMPAGAMLVRIDTKTDEVTVTRDERCTSLLSSMTTPDGDAYFFSSYENAYVRIATEDKHGVHDCALRVRKGDSTFDPDWSLDISERVDGRPADGVLPGAGNTIWVRAFHADQLDEQPKDYDAIDSAPAWQWHKLDISSDGDAVESSDQPYSSHGTAGIVVQGRSFLMVPNEDYSESDLVELKGDKLLKQASVVGELNSLVRVR